MLAKDAPLVDSRGSELACLICRCQPFKLPERPADSRRMGELMAYGDGLSRHLMTRDELLRQVMTQLPPEEVEFMHWLSQWATPERVGFLLEITQNVANSVLPKDVREWSELPPEDPQAEWLMSQTGYVMLREGTTGRSSAADGNPPHFPEEQIIHFCRLWAMEATHSLTPEVAHLLGILGEAEQQLVHSPDDEIAQRAHATAHVQLDHVLDLVMAADEELNRYAMMAFLFVFTDDPDQALRI